jgi:hypothetical protein
MSRTFNVSCAELLLPCSVSIAAGERREGGHLFPPPCPPPAPLPPSNLNVCCVDCVALFPTWLWSHMLLGQCELACCNSRLSSLMIP